MTHLVRKWDEDSSVQAYHCTSLMKNYTKGDSPVECLYDLVVKKVCTNFKSWHGSRDDNRYYHSLNIDNKLLGNKKTM